MTTDGGISIGLNRGWIAFKADITGLQSLRLASSDIQKAVDAELRKGLFVAAKRVEAEAKKSLQQGGKTGRTYTLRAAIDGEEPTAWFTLNGRSVGFVKRAKPHTASAPGEAPATDTGRLVNSINASPDISKESNELIASVGAGGGMVDYARYLEFGTHSVAARPFMQPALERAREFIAERLAQAVSNGIWKGSRAKKSK